MLLDDLSGIFSRFPDKNIFAFEAADISKTIKNGVEGVSLATGKHFPRLGLEMVVASQPLVIITTNNHVLLYAPRKEACLAGRAFFPNAVKLKSLRYVTEKQSRKRSIRHGRIDIPLENAEMQGSLISLFVPVFRQDCTAVIKTSDDIHSYPEFSLYA